MKKNAASQAVGAQMITAADGTAFTGAVTVYVTGDAGTQAVGSVGSGACTHEGNGYHTYAPAQAETNYDLVAFTFIGTGAIPCTVQIYTHYPQTGDSYARIGAPAGASVSADIAAIEAQTDDIGAAGAGLTAVPWNAAWDSEVQSECDDALAARGVTTTRTGYLDNLSAGAVATAAKLLSYFQSSLRSDVTVDADIGGTYDDATDSQQAIRDRGDAAWTTATGFSTHSAADIWAAGTRTLTAIDEDSTTLDLDATVRAAVGMASADLDSQLAALPTAAEAATAVLTTAMTESYAADGDAPTLAQMQYMLWSYLSERSIASVTLTAKKLDGSTTAMTFTLDDADAPTSITRAT